MWTTHISPDKPRHTSARIFTVNPVSVQDITAATKHNPNKPSVFIQIENRASDPSKEKTPEDNGKHAGTDTRAGRKATGTNLYTSWQVQPARSSNAGTTESNAPSKVNEATPSTDGEGIAPLLVVETVLA